MNIECVKEKLLNALNKAERVVGKNMNLPILGFIILETNKNFLIIKATNIELGIEIKIPAKIEVEGVVAIPSGVLTSLLTNTTGKSVSLKLEGDLLNVSLDNNKSSIKTTNSDDFPDLPKVDGSNFKIKIKDLINGFKSVWYSASVSGVKPELSSVYLYTEDGKINFVSTDGFRLAEKSLKTKNSSFEGILIPSKNITEIIRIFDDMDEDIEIISNKNQISFLLDNVYLTSRVVDGNFPDYKQLLPKESLTEVVILKQDLLSFLKIANIFSGKFNHITFNINPQERYFKIYSKNTDIGENFSNIDATLSGESVEISFNYKYILDCLQSIETDSLVMKFNGSGKPLVIKSIPDKGFTYLVMPVNK